MIILNEENQILLEYKQKPTTKNKKYNYKELTIPSDLYNLWVLRNNNQPVQSATLITVMNKNSQQSYITPQPEDKVQITQQQDSPEHYTTTLKIRINKSKPDKNGKQKQKATMTINKNVQLVDNMVTFIIDPHQEDFGAGHTGLCNVEGLVVIQEKKE